MNEFRHKETHVGPGVGGIGRTDDEPCVDVCRRQQYSAMKCVGGRSESSGSAMNPLWKGTCSPFVTNPPHPRPVVSSRYADNRITLRSPPIIGMAAVALAVGLAGCSHVEVSVENDTARYV